MKTIPSISLESDLLYRALIAVEVGETITYETLTAITKRDVRGEGAGNLATARKKALMQDQAVFGTVRTVGLQRLDDSGRFDVTKSYLLRSRRAVRRSKRVAATVDPAKLSPEEAEEYRSAVTTAAVLELVTRPAEQKKLASAVKSKGSELPTKEVLELFSK